MKTLLLLSILVVPLLAQTTPVEMTGVTVYSPRVANQEPTETFAMPVSSLRFDPRVDLETRSFAEAQADVTIRGDIFENTGFRLGAVSQTDSQTGHYLAEIPIAPTMLAAPEILTGADQAAGTINSTVGAVAFGWRPIKTAGALTAGAGSNHLDREEFYQGYADGPSVAGQGLGADVAWAHSRDAGAVAFGEEHFNRVNGRLQLAGKTSQTDLYAGYQAKYFGWPNLYTPFNSDETENLETLLYGINHRTELGGGDFIEAGAYARRNKDDYAFNRFAPLGSVHPFQHTTREQGAAADGRSSFGALALDYRGEVFSDQLKSTSLTFGRHHSRVLSKASLIPEYTWTLADRSRVTVKAGAAVDNSSRDGTSGSPVVEVARDWATGDLRRVYLSYAQATQLPSYTALDSAPQAGLFRGNANLCRETSHNLETGVSGSLAGWTTQAALFYRRDNALVDWTFKNGVIARTANAVDVDTTGLELAAQRTWGPCDLVLGYTVLGKSADYRGAAVDASFYALNYARQRLTAALTARLGGGFEVRLDNVARVQAANLLRTVGGNQALTTSLGLIYRPAELRGCAVTVQAENLWNSSFQEVPSVPAAPRRISGGVSYAW